MVRNISFYTNTNKPSNNNKTHISGSLTAIDLKTILASGERYTPLGYKRPSPHFKSSKVCTMKNERKNDCLNTRQVSDFSVMKSDFCVYIPGLRPKLMSPSFCHPIPLNNLSHLFNHSDSLVNRHARAPIKIVAQTSPWLLCHCTRARASAFLPPVKRSSSGHRELFRSLRVCAIWIARNDIKFAENTSILSFEDNLEAVRFAMIVCYFNSLWLTERQEKWIYKDRNPVFLANSGHEFGRIRT